MYRTIDYTYDALRRLKDAHILQRIGAQGGETQDYKYDYDLRGNRTRARFLLNGNLDIDDVYTYDPANRIATRTLTKSGGDPIIVGYQYDPAGNLKNDGQSNYTYDRANRLTGLTPVQTGTSFAYHYNGLGMRTQQQVLTTGAPTIATDYLLDLASPLPSVLRESKAGDSTWYLHGMGQALGAKRAGIRMYFGYDALGSVRQVYDGGNVLQPRCGGAAATECVQGALDYDPYGMVTRREGAYVDLLSLGYTGEMTDASGLVYLRARYMNPATGTFLTRDPVEGTLDRINSRNGYSYVEGNPANGAVGEPIFTPGDSWLI